MYILRITQRRRFVRSVWKVEKDVDVLFAGGEWTCWGEDAAECDGYAGFVFIRTGGYRVHDLGDAEGEI
jgi:hypothetical protein